MFSPLAYLTRAPQQPILATVANNTKNMPHVDPDVLGHAVVGSGGGYWRAQTTAMQASSDPLPPGVYTGHLQLAMHESSCVTASCTTCRDPAYAQTDTTRFASATSPDAEALATNIGFRSIVLEDTSNKGLRKDAGGIHFGVLWRTRVQAASTRNHQDIAVRLLIHSVITTRSPIKLHGLPPVHAKEKQVRISRWWSCAASAASGNRPVICHAH